MKRIVISAIAASLLAFAGVTVAAPAADTKAPAKSEKKAHKKSHKKHKKSEAPAAATGGK